jgi:hypothetical protein
MRTFVVCCTYRPPSGETLGESIKDNDAFLYGDPPRHEEETYLGRSAERKCIAGDAMNTLAVRVIEFWKRVEGQWEWARDGSLERLLDHDEQEEIQSRRW